VGQEWFVYGATGEKASLLIVVGISDTVVWHIEVHRKGQERGYMAKRLRDMYLL
jgi:hypothetical protein